MEEITFPAAMQHIHELYRSLSNVSGVALRGFHSRRVHDFFAQHYPGVPIVESSPEVMMGAGPERPLIVDKFESESQDEPNAPEHAQYRVALDRLLDCYRVNPVSVDLSNL
jgi:hypothetical protein